MPVYEFYCTDCHTIFNFLARRVTTDRRPACPRCGRQELERQVSAFAFSRGRTEEPAGEFPSLDEAKLEKAMLGLAGEMEGMDENDPRQMAHFMRRLTEATGMDLGDGMDEAIRRLEAGEDPDTVGEEMGDLLEGENPFAREKVKGWKRKYTPPAHDDTLYVL